MSEPVPISRVTSLLGAGRAGGPFRVSAEER